MVKQRMAFVYTRISALEADRQIDKRKTNKERERET